MLAPSKVDDAETTPERPTSHKALSRALVVFLKTQAHIYFLSGTSHVVHMPFEVESGLCIAIRGHHTAQVKDRKPPHQYL